MKTRLIAGLGCFLLAGSIGLAAETSSSETAGQVSFKDDVLPILRRNCFRCHGSKNQEAGLQLNRRASVLGEDASPDLVRRNDASNSLLLKRIVDDSEGDRMPIDAEPLPDADIAILRQWIAGGAPWPDSEAEPIHWAYEPIKRPAVVATSEHGKAAPSFSNPIDSFVSQRLARRGLSLQPREDRARLLRRVSLALTGLPPSPSQVEVFQSDSSPEAYERAVDRLLESPAYGERWAVPWLDLARYADSNGFQADQIRDNWAYRDWVIRMINQEQPFDEFVIDQLAGDLRPNATIDQRIATGFHRMTTCNVEAGVHPEANRVNQVVDRVNTTATVFLGTTIECAQCHDHKYDPFSQEDYYRLFAYFNNTPLEVENTSGVTWDFYGPTLELPLEETQQQHRKKLQQELAALQAKKKSAVAADDDAFDAWLASVRVAPDVTWQIIRPAAFASSRDEDFEIQPDGSVLLSGSVPDTVDHTFTFDVEKQTASGDPIAPPGHQIASALSPGSAITAIRIEVLTDPLIPGNGPGRGDEERTNIILSELTCQVIDGADKREVALTDAAADFSQVKWNVSNAIDGDRKTGWAISPQFGKPHWASFAFEEPLQLSSGQRLSVNLGQYYGRGRVIGKPRISFYDGDLSLRSLDPELRELAKKSQLSAKERDRLREVFNQSNPALKRLDRQIRSVQKQLDQLAPDTTLVMVELEQPRETFVMVRGDYESLDKQVTAGTPTILPTDSSIERSGDRLELARWLTSPSNPLLARVTVNRWWGSIFGQPLVRTPEDFGTQGEEPTHPQVLDWLAAELIESGWSRKRIHKLIVMSETFQQSARLTEELRNADPENRLLSRGPRYRLPAELIRDNALAVSGLLSDKMFGPPVMPYQPDDIWRSVGRNQPTWKAAANEDRFRRGLYVIWKRAAPYPSFINFDAPDRGSCTVNRGRSNTPLQALTLLNDPAYAEMALAMADRILSEAPATDDRTRIEFAFRLAVARSPNADEVLVIERLLKRERSRMQEQPERVNQRTKPPLPMIEVVEDRVELAAWFAVANVLLNLDETMSL